MKIFLTERGVAVADLLGREVPRVFTPPIRPLTPETSLGFAFCDFCDDFGFDLYPWQRWLAIHALELNPDGSFRFRIILTIVARQNGKTVFGKLLSLFFLYCLQVQLVLGTSLSLDQAEEVWDAVVMTAEEDPELSQEIVRVRRANGQKSLELTGNRKYKVSAVGGAASRKGGRGKSVDLLLLDELREHTSWDAWGAATKTTLARPNALIFCMTNAGDQLSVVLFSLRLRAHAALGDPDGLCKLMQERGTMPEASPDEEELAIGYFEWSAPPGMGVWDREGWAMANPSMGYGSLTERALASAAATDDEWVFRTECLCQWRVGTVARPFPEGAWEAGVDEGSRIAARSRLSFGLDVSSARDYTSIAVCGLRDDRLRHVELCERREGVQWAVEWLAERADPASPLRVAVQGRGAPVASIIDELEAVEGLEVVRCEGPMLGAWSARLYDGVSACADMSDAVPVMHISQPALDEAAARAAKKKLGDGTFAFDRNASPVDISPLIAAALALGLATQADAPAKQRKTYESAYEQGKHVLVI